MVKKLEILGMELHNYTVREAMLQVEVFLNNTIVNTIETISMESLVRAQTDELLKQCIESLDLVIIRDKEILKAAGVDSAQRIRETVENEFQKEFMKCASRNNRTVFLLGDTKERVAAFQKFLSEKYNQIKIVGTYALADCEGDYDTVNNEINIAEPDIILSVISTPEQEYFLEENKDKLNVKVWYGMGDAATFEKGLSEVTGFAKKLIQKGRLHSMILRYKKKSE